jgi:hypothetical protein
MYDGKELKMVEDELITTRFGAFAGANDHPPAAFPNRDV